MFCGAGGCSYGAKNAGATILAGFDNWDPAIKVYTANFPGVKTYSEDIRQINPRKIKKDIGEIDLILASPECTNHSIAKGAGERSEESRDTAFEVVRFARVIKPTWIVVENVVEIARWHKYNEFIQDLRNLGYFVRDDIILNAKDFGVPQSRIRRFILCSLLKQPENITPKGHRKRTAKKKYLKILANINIHL